MVTRDSSLLTRDSFCAGHFRISVFHTFFRPPGQMVEKRQIIQRLQNFQKMLAKSGTLALELAKRKGLKEDMQMTNSVLNTFVALSVLLVLWPINTVAQNQRPVAEAGLSRYAAGDPVHLDGSGSYDPDNSGPLSYAWRQIAGPAVVLTGADTAAPTVGGFVQTSDIQECEFELVVSDPELASVPDTVKVVIVPSFGPSMLKLENASFDPNKPTVIYFGGGDCINGYSGQLWNGGPAWTNKANVIGFPSGYKPDSGATGQTYYKYGDMIIVYLSSVAPDYRQPIQTSGWSTGGQPAIDVALRLNLTYKDARYGVNRVTFLEATPYCRDYSESIRSFLASSVEGEQCWIDNYVNGSAAFFPNVLNVAFSLSHAGVPLWYLNSLTGSDMNQFNNGVVAGAYWSVAGPGKNLHLASTPGAQTYNFTWNGGASSGNMSFYNESLCPGRLPEPVTLLVWRYPWLADGDPNGLVLTCAESENAVGCQLLSGSDPYNIADYNIVADSNSCPAIAAAMLPSSDTWWTVRVRDAYGSTIYADPIGVDSLSALGAIPAELVDFNQDFKVDMQDFSEFARHWREYEPSVDIIPAPNGDGVVDVKDLAILLECWLKETRLPFGLVAYWKLDETEGLAAHDRAGTYEGALHGDPLWQPTSGKVKGALQFDGVDDYVSTPFILDPAEGAFSVFAWVKGGGPEQAIISQARGVNWLAAGTSQGKLMTELKAAGRFGTPLFSEAVIIDGDWHRVGLTWDGSTRTLFVDNVEVAKGTQGTLAGSQGGLYIGAGKNLEAGSFWSGLIDDVKIYDRAVTP